MPLSPLFEGDNDDRSKSLEDEEHLPDDTKESPTTPIAIGAIQVNERANMLYTRQYRGRNRFSQRVRIREERARREEAIANDSNGIRNEDGETNRPSTAGRRRKSSVFAQMVRDYSNYFGTATVESSHHSEVVSAVVVEDSDVVVATEMNFCERNWKKIAIILSALLAILAILLSVFIVAFNKDEEILKKLLEPTASPTPNPNLKPTLHTVQERGFIRCGLNNQVNSGTFHLDLCRAIASVMVGDADKYEIIPTTFGTRWAILSQNVDALIGADTHTIEREVRVASEGNGFTFSASYNFDGMTYAGNETFIKCAEEKKRFGICSSLSICVYADGTSFRYVASIFPPEFIVTTSSTDEMVSMMDNGTCKVVGTEVSLIYGSEALRSNSIGQKQFTKGPHAIVTRNTDREFSDIVNWVLQALFYGEEQGLTKNAKLCSSTTNITSVASELNYLNAVYCVGSYNELYYFPGYRGMNRINNGTALHYPLPFGDLDYAFGLETPDWEDFGPRPGSTLSDITIDTKLNCGVAFQTSNDTENLAIADMSADYCRTIAAAVFYGDYEAVDLLNFSSIDEAFFALQNGTIDVLAGTNVEKSRDFEGFQFSTPYYYKSGTSREALIAFAIATREDDSLFSSLVNCVVLATLYAEESGTLTNQVPFASIFGYEMRWSLRDAVSYSGPYDMLFKKHFGIGSVRARNGLNRMNEAGPQLHSLPSIE